MKAKKLIVSLCMLMLTICTLAFGVYAAIRANFTASGTISFSAINADCDITVSIYGTTSGDALDSTTNSTDYIFTSNTVGAVTGLKKQVLYATTKGSTESGRATFYNSGAGVVNESNPLQLGTLEFDELNTALNGQGATWLNKIVIVLDVKNYSSYDIKMTVSEGEDFDTDKFLLNISDESVTAKASGTDDTCQIVLIILPNTETSATIQNNLLNINIEPNKTEVHTLTIQDCSVPIQAPQMSISPKLIGGGGAGGGGLTPGQQPSGGEIDSVFLNGERVYNGTYQLTKATTIIVKSTASQINVNGTSYAATQPVSAGDLLTSAEINITDADISISAGMPSAFAVEFTLTINYIP